ncbi:hypothetical protein JOD43_003277 [Pullulanibacillus pueri]|uniref:DUF2521 family protein n=1 Tax=Pullulanibacillus pueri TaxID=1437324 RepID=A0A8J2ZXZ3_9BACL|nr:DUF2521 family protein [Pullulanibacillus pueri]MBM7683098.1 hypothetical protein [Pullulanibacillus pueri]GGH85277.1 hypothetical protein GCM10007096_30290 [Pullulanibacillus pueri]
MGTVMSFHEKYRYKQLDLERKALKDLSLPEVEAIIKDYFEPFLQKVHLYRQTISDMCLDYAIEASLLGASFGRFGYYGEDILNIYARSEKQLKVLTDDLFDFWMFWYSPDDVMIQSLYTACQGFLYYWWKDGLENAIRRYRLKLH